MDPLTHTLDTPPRQSLSSEPASDCDTSFSTTGTTSRTHNLLAPFPTTPSPPDSPPRVRPAQSGRVVKSSSFCSTGEPIRPTPLFNANEVPDLTDNSVYTTRLAPWRDPRLPSAQGIPPYSRSMESYFVIHPKSAWACLENEFEEQQSFLVDLAGWRRAREAGGAEHAELERLSCTSRAVQAYLGELFSHLAGLSFVRKLYVAHYRPYAKAWTDEEIIANTLGFEKRSSDMSGKQIWECEAEPDSVWALPIPLGAPGKPLTRLCDLPAHALRPYRLPKLDPNYHLTFRPMSIEEFQTRFPDAGTTGPPDFNFEAASQPTLSSGNDGYEDATRGKVEVLKQRMKGLILGGARAPHGAIRLEDEDG